MDCRAAASPLLAMTVLSYLNNAPILDIGGYARAS